MILREKVLGHEGLEAAAVILLETRPGYFVCRSHVGFKIGRKRPRESFRATRMSGSERGRNEGKSPVWQPVFRRLTSKNDQGFIRRVVTIDLLHGRGVLRVCRNGELFHRPSPASPAPATYDHAIAPPSSVMNSRRFIRSPRRRVAGDAKALRGRALWQF